jgi:hypothetical protein
MIGEEGEEYVLETQPGDRQKERLEDFLTELKIVSRQHGVLLVPWAGEIAVYDLLAKTIIGVGFSYVVDVFDHGQITGYDCTDSILDGAWPVGTDGATQHELGTTWPLREGQPEDWQERR